MKNYRITVNGISYDVCVEELPEGSINPAAYAPVQAAAPVAAPAAAPKPAAAAKPTAPAAPAKPAGGKTGSIKVEAPMPGKIVGIKVNVGDVVKDNQVVAVLEAMKMENEIVAPKGGTVASIEIESGADVNSGDVLITIAE